MDLYRYIACVFAGEKLEFQNVMYVVNHVYGWVLTFEYLSLGYVITHVTHSHAEGSSDVRKCHILFYANHYLLFFVLYIYVRSVNRVGKIVTLVFMIIFGTKILFLT